MPRSGAGAGTGGMANTGTAAASARTLATAPRRRAEPVASTSRQTVEMSDEDDDDDEELDDNDEDASMEGEGEDMEDTRQPNFAQYMGDSEVEEVEEVEEEDGNDGEDSDGNNDRGDASADERGVDIDSIQQELRSIPLKTLLKAQKKLAASTANAKSAKGRRSANQQQDEEGDDAHAAAAGPGKLRKGRQISRRGMAPDLLVPRKDKIDGYDATQARRKGKVKQHRDSKHAPTEMSSKRAVTRNRTVVEVESNKRRDPRFDNLSGAYDARQFSESYAFLNDARQDEIKRLKSALHATKKRVGAVDLVEREAMHRELGRLQTKQAAYEKQQREKQAVGSWREQEDKKQSEGKKAFYLKAAQRKAIIADTRMQELQKDKRKLHKATEKQKQRDRKKDFKSAPPMRQV